MVEERVWRRASSFVTRLAASRRANSRLPRSGVSPFPRPEWWRIGGFRRLERFRQRRQLGFPDVSPRGGTSCLVFSPQKRGKSMIFDRFPGQRGGEEERGRLIPGRGPSRCGGMNYIERPLAEKFSGSHSRENSSQGCSFEVAPTDRRRMMENKWKFFQGIYIGPARLTFPSLSHPKARKFVSS